MNTYNELENIIEKKNNFLIIKNLQELFKERYWFNYKKQNK